MPDPRVAVAGASCAWLARKSRIGVSGPAVSARQVALESESRTRVGQLRAGAGRLPRESAAVVVREQVFDFADRARSASHASSETAARSSVKGRRCGHSD